MEQLCAHFPEWPYTPSDARFLGSPIDYVVFDGMSSGDVKKVVIVEVKTGNSSTSKLQNSIKRAIKEGRVEFKLLKIESKNDVCRVNKSRNRNESKRPKA